MITIILHPCRVGIIQLFKNKSIFFDALGSDWHSVSADTQVLISDLALRRKKMESEPLQLLKPPVTLQWGPWDHNLRITGIENPLVVTEKANC